MKTRRPKQTLSSTPFPALLILLFLFASGSVSAGSIITDEIDINGDGTLNILVLGTNSSFNGGEAFSPDRITDELQSILSADESSTLDINVVAEDIHLSKVVTVGLGGAGNQYNWNHHSHSLTQYYYWPEGLADRMANLRGEGGTDWDYVVIGADPNIVSMVPGYYALGVNKIAAKVTEGDAVPLLLMLWSTDESDGASIEHFEEFTYRTADGTSVPLATVPAGLAWDALPEGKKDVASFHPTPNGAYVAAAAIYAHIYEQSAAASDYTYDDEIADIASTTVNDAPSEAHYSGLPTFISPYKSCDIEDDIINYNHTGTSSENGIKAGMQWVFNQAPHTLQNGGTPPIDLNYGRANSNFEPNKRYRINPEQFDFSFGFPMQDHGNNGDESMLYGLDRRQSGTMNDTDLGTARFMVEQDEIPYARAIPVRTLFAQMKEVSPSISAYRDSWHMHRDLDKAIGAYMYTLLTGNCALGDEPADQDSDSWRTWMAHKIGFETAWTLMYMEGDVPDCSLFVDEDGDGFFAFDDCDDTNSNINPDIVEEPYNGIDDDCDPATLDDDLDQDGFIAAEDCDDTNANINADQEEVPYNGLDDDCDPSTLDDDLDQDGFVLADDCDDTNASVNPDQEEEPYNGLDDDCDPSTLDDDLDQDGYPLAEDCDDTNAMINYDAEEIPNNGIDEDCDGTDLITSTYELANSTLDIYPNPAVDIINIEVSGNLNYSVSLYDLQGQLLANDMNATTISVASLPNGVYLLEIRNLESPGRIVERIVKGAN